MRMGIWGGGTVAALSCCLRRLPHGGPRREVLIMKTLSEDQLARWKHDGFLSPFLLLDKDELQTCRDGLRRFEEWLGGPVNAIADMKWRTMPYRLMPWATKLANDPRILDAVEDLLGPDLLIYTSTFFIKEPHSPTILPGTRTRPITVWSCGRRSLSGLR
jgi:hypothetical protein